MTWFRSLCIAVSMYSRLPVPYGNWDKKEMKYSIGLFPIVGAVIGVMTWLWLWGMRRIAAAGTTELPDVVFLAVSTLIAAILPVLVTGGIHVDGFMDTCDAFHSWADRDKKLQILSFKYHKEAQSGQLLSKLISDTQFVEMLIYDRLQDVLHLIIDVLIVLCLALLHYPPMLLFYVIIVPVSLMIIRSFSKPILRRKTVMRRRTEKSSVAFKEMLEMDQLTRSHGLQKEEFRKISSEVSQVQEAAHDFDTVNVAVNCVTYGGFQGFRLLCLCFAAFLFTRGHISMGTVVLFQSLFGHVS